MVNVAPILEWLAEAAVWLGALGLVLVALAVCGRNFFQPEDDDDPWCCICTYPAPDSVGECRACRRRVLT